MNTEIEIASTQLQREIARAQKLFDDDPRLDWKTYNMAKSALLAVVPLLPEAVVSQVRELLRTISVAYLRGAERAELLPEMADHDDVQTHIESSIFGGTG